MDEAKLKELFGVLDKNKDGSITPEELEEGLKLMKLPYAHAAQLLKGMDTNHDGTINLEEFSAFAQKQHQQLRKVFDELDTDKSGSIDVDELKVSLEKLNIEYDEVELTKLIRRMDKDQNGKIDFNEWRDFLLLAPETNIEAIFRYWEDAKALDSEDGIMIPPKIKSMFDSVAYLSSGAIAAMTSRTATAPLERIRTLYQIQTVKPSIATISAQIWQESGIRGFWRGNLANCIKVAPEKAIKFWAYESVKRFFAENEADITAQQRFIAGGAAGVFTHTLSFPLEVIKTRLAAAPHGMYTGIIDCVVKTFKGEGILAFWRGITPALLSTAPHSGIDLTVYELAKNAFMKRSGQEPRVPELLACASISSVAGLLSCYPLHVAKTRMVMQGLHGGPRQYNTFFDVWVQAWRKEGPMGLYRGLLPSMLKSVPSHCITFVTYEFLKKQFKIEKKHHH